MPYQIHKPPSNLPLKGWVVGGRPGMMVGFAPCQKSAAVAFAQEWAQEHEILHVMPVIDHGLGVTLLARVEAHEQGLIEPKGEGEP